MPGVLTSGPSDRSWGWQRRGSCHGLDTTLFFGAEGEERRARVERVHRAKEVCRLCPVIGACRDEALAFGEPHGIWGGLTVAERHALMDGSAPTRRGANTPPLSFRRTALQSAAHRKFAADRQEEG